MRVSVEAAIPVILMAGALACSPQVAISASEGQGVFGLNTLETRFFEALALIVAACIFVPLSMRMGLGTVIGYLAAGVLVGAVLSFSFSAHPEDLLHFAEFGIVLFLFVIGLEFRPSRLWELRGTILGRGLVQVVATGLALGLVLYFYGLDWRASLIIGLGLALSSTALVMQDIDAKGERRSKFGQTAISVLLFEDLAIVPLLMLVALLAPAAEAVPVSETLEAVLWGAFAITLLILVGRFLLNSMFDVLAKTQTSELMTASALGVVIAASLLMATVGLSYALGAFIAGVMLAASAYRHEIEADIEPFRALFLGLFFLAVGFSLDLSAVVANAGLILVAVPVLVTVKSLVIYGVSRLFRSGHDTSLRIALAMSQHGEFGFVLFASAFAAGLLSSETSAIAVTIVTLSMALSSQSDKLSSLLKKRKATDQLTEDFSDAHGQVLIIGFGRVGQMVSQVLLSQGVSVVLLDHDADRVREARQFGTRVHFGDGRRKDILVAAGAQSAQVILLATDNPDTTFLITDLIRQEFPQSHLVVRAYDRVEAVRLGQLAPDIVVRETLGSAFDMGRAALITLGYGEADADAAAQKSRSVDAGKLEEQAREVADLSKRDDIVQHIRPQRIRGLRRAVHQSSKDKSREIH
ncbi:MAG: cation:proton antiporter [Pseudomonadota bacterium]